jgi:hypothetical protein
MKHSEEYLHVYVYVYGSSENKGFVGENSTINIINKNS